MNVTATLNGESVTIVGITTNGQTVAIAYVDSSGNFRVANEWMEPGSSPKIFATGAVVV